ncbi:MAG TPA: hypothetical protein DCR94_02695 [Firmicutes bacterium]|nr:hypothetical protein [Bacillota bacterium]
MKNKETLQEKINHRKYHRPNKFLYSLLKNVVIDRILAPKYNIHYQINDDINKEKGPCFLIFNHQSRIDYVWAVQATYPRRLNFVVGYNEFFRSHLKFILKIANAIPKKNFVIDLPSMRGIDSIIKQGGTIAFSPEGMSSISGHNQPVVAGTGKFFKHYGIPIYLLKTEGAFLTNTKSCLDERKGRIDAQLVKLFSSEDLKQLDADEIEAKVNKALTHDDYVWNEKEQVHYETFNHICKDMEYICYKCPSCGTEFQMKGEGDKIYCKKCGCGAKVDDTYALSPLTKDSKLPKNISNWFDLERKDVYNEIKINPHYEFKQQVKLGKLDPYKPLKNKKTSLVCGEGEFIINHEGVSYNGTKDGASYCFKLDYDEINTFGMPTDTSYLSLYYDGQYFDIIPTHPTSIKMLLLVEEMHRLHVNRWKALPNESWIYD